MFSNYLKMALRNLQKHKGYSLLNISGLAIGIACFVILFLYVSSELSYDTYFKNGDRTYRVFVKQDISGIKQNNSKTPGLLGPTLLQEIPETESYTRIGYYGNYRFRYKEHVFNTGYIYAVDSTFFDVFTVPFIEGNPKTVLNRPNTIVITQTVARKYFGDESPLGKMLTVDNPMKADYLNREKGFSDNSESFLITGLVEDFPENTHFRCDYFSSISTYEVNEYWLDLWYQTYIVLKEDSNPDLFNEKLQKIARDNVGPLAQGLLGISFEEFLNSGNTYTYKLQPVSSIYLSSQNDYGIDLNTEWGNVKTSNITYVYIFSAVALFILLIAIINFMNLATARSEERAKEVGIRKTLGSNKSKIIIQFISEAILMSLISVIVALVLVEILLPFFNSMVDKELNLNLFNNFYALPLIAGFILFVGVVAGSYPAFYLSSFMPIKVLKSNYTRGNRKNLIRSGLVILQFTVSVCLLIGTLVIRNQLDFIQNKNLGFNKEQLVSITNADVLGTSLQTFKQELLRNTQIISVCNSSQMFRAGIPGSGYLFNQKSTSDPYACQFVDADYDFQNTYQTKLKQGRFFSKEYSTDTSAVLINETALKLFGDNEPVGKEITRIGRSNWTKTFKIIGVIKDFNFESLHQAVRPLIIHYSPPEFANNTLTIRIKADEMKGTIEFINQTWKNLKGNEHGMYLHFVDENIARLYEAEERTNIIATVFTILTIFIACLGVFGLAAFVTVQRTKEIGIRKTLGASVGEIIVLLSKEFAIWILIANMIAWPIAFFTMKQWLQNFAYQVDMGIWTFVLAGGAALIIALVTVSFQAVKAALANPVESLRYE